MAINNENEMQEAAAVASKESAIGSALKDAQVEAELKQYAQSNEYAQQSNAAYEQTARPQPQQPRYEEPTMNQKQPSTPKLTSFHSGGLFAAPISRSIGSEAYNRLKVNLTEMYKEVVDPNIEMALLDLNNDTEQALKYSSLIVAMRHKDKPKHVAYHILLLEMTGDEILPITEWVNNKQVEITRVAGDALDLVLVDMADAKVAKAFPRCERYMVDGCVVPRNFNPDDKYMLHRLALSAGLACGTELEMADPDFQDINLAAIERDASLNINIAFNKQQLEDAVGGKMRSDVLINFESRKRNEGQRGMSSVNSGDREVKVSEVSGFMDLVVAGQPATNPFNAYMQQQQMQQPQQQNFAARLILTNLTSNYSYTIGSMLLSVYTAMSLRDDNNWIQAFRPNVDLGKEIDMTDIGALNIPGNIKNEAGGWGTRIDTKADTFKLEQLGQLVAALIRPGLVVSMDCPEAGPQSWYMSVFAAASNNSGTANRVVYDAAMKLTNGALGQYFGQDTPIFVDGGNRVHTGTWTDKNGNVRDIRDIDYLAVCNLVGERNPNYIREWSDTFLNTDIPLIQRLDARKRMISAMTNETAVFTGFAQRVTFNGAFLDALSRGIMDTGIFVKVNSPLSGSDFNVSQSSAQFLNSALMQPGHSFMAPPSFGNQYNYGAQNQFKGRW